MAIWKRENNKIPQNREMKFITWQINWEFNKIGNELWTELI